MIKSFLFELCVIFAYHSHTHDKMNHKKNYEVEGGGGVDGILSFIDDTYLVLIACLCAFTHARIHASHALRPLQSAPLRSLDPPL